MKIVPDEHILRIVEAARHNTETWNQIEYHERYIEMRNLVALEQGKNIDDNDLIFESPERPYLSEIVDNLMEAHLEDYKSYYMGGLTVQLRRQARINLGLPI